MENEGRRRLREKKRRSSSTPRNAFFYGLSVIPDNRYLTEWILSVKPRLYADKLLILNNLFVKPYLFTDKLSILSQLFTVIRFMVASQTASQRKKLNIQADSPKLVKPSSRIARVELRVSHG